MESPFKLDVLKGKVALITGGGSGIGFEISTQFGKHGAAGAKSSTPPSLPFVPSEFPLAAGFEGDVRKQEDARRVVESTYLSPKGFRTDIDLVGTFTMCREALKYLQKEDSSSGGSILSILRMQSRLSPVVEKRWMDKPVGVPTSKL